MGEMGLFLHNSYLLLGLQQMPKKALDMSCIATNPCH